jgi:hypothetical protein
MQLDLRGRCQTVQSLARTPVLSNWTVHAHSDQALGPIHCSSRQVKSTMEANSARLLRVQLAYAREEADAKGFSAKVSRSCF